MKKDLTSYIRDLNRICDLLRFSQSDDAAECLWGIENDKVLFSGIKHASRKDFLRVYQRRYQLKREGLAGEEVKGIKGTIANLEASTDEHVSVCQVIAEDLTYIIVANENLQTLHGILRSGFLNLSEANLLQKEWQDKEITSSFVRFYKNTPV